MRSKSVDFLLEVGCEEIPADYLAAMLDWDWPDAPGLSSIAGKLLAENRVVFRRLQSFATYRRLVLKIENVEPTVKETILGPPISVALDSQDRPTLAAQRFARKQGVKVSALKRAQTPQGERLVAERRIRVEDRLIQIVPTILQKLTFPKTMRWNESNFRFVRPIRWVLALCGSKPLRISVAGVQSGSVTFGSRRYGEKPVPVKSAASCFSALSRMKVHLEQGRPFEREQDGTLKALAFEKKKRQAVLQRLKEAARKRTGKLADETTEEFNWLLDTVTFLTEDPYVESGSFEKAYLDLPSEVLATSMAKYLKLFSVFSADGRRLIPHFLAVLEGRPKDPKRVLKNIERILEARFSDAQFFYREDTRSPLKTKIPQLATLIFHEKLGTVADRIPRLARLMEGLSDLLKFTDLMKGQAQQVAQLSKADLVTQMVREFPSLQGIVGARYALADGEPKEVAEALAEQYLPRSSGDSVPRTLLGALISLADRIDALIGFFGAGLKPTGSLDPYGLRRQALGLVRILLEPPPGISFVGLSVDRVFDEGIQSWGKILSVDPRTLKVQLKAFLRERFEWLAESSHPVNRELLEAVLATDEDDLAGAWERLGILRRLWTDSGRREELIRAAKVAQRSGLLVQSAKILSPLKEVNPGLFQESAEKMLWAQWQGLKPQLALALKGRRFEEATLLYGKLYDPIHQFFSSVFVMGEDPDLRINRISFMKQIHEGLATSFADLSKLPLGPAAS